MLWKTAAVSRLSVLVSAAANPLTVVEVGLEGRNQEIKISAPNLCDTQRGTNFGGGAWRRKFAHTDTHMSSGEAMIPPRRAHKHKSNSVFSATFYTATKTRNSGFPKKQRVEQ